MNPDIPTTASVRRGSHSIVRADFATTGDACGFIHAQARASTASRDSQLWFQLSTSDGVLAEAVAAGPDIIGEVVRLLADLDEDGLTYARVPGHTALIYAYRSRSSPGAIHVGVDADEGERIKFFVNDGLLADTTVDHLTGAVNTPPRGDGYQMTCEIIASSWHDASLIASAIACAQPVRLGQIEPPPRAPAS